MWLSWQMFFEWLRNPVTPFNAEKKLFNPAQVALSKILRNEAKIYQKTDFLSSEGHLLTSPGCCMTLTSSLDVEQVRFASLKPLPRFVRERPFLSPNRFSSFARVQCLHFSSSKVRYYRFLGRLLRSYFAFYVVALKSFVMYVFKWYFVMPS